MSRRRPAAFLSALALTALLAGCAWQVEGGGVVTGQSGEPAGRAVLTVEEQAGWPTPLATVTLPTGEIYSGKVIVDRTDPGPGFAIGTGWTWGPRRGPGVGFGTVLNAGPERSSRASALLFSPEGRSMSCDIRTTYPGRLQSGGFADCRISDGRTVALEF